MIGLYRFPANIRLRLAKTRRFEVYYGREWFSLQKIRLIVVEEEDEKKLIIKLKNIYIYFDRKIKIY